MLKEKSVTDIARVNTIIRSTRVIKNLATAKTQENKAAKKIYLYQKKFGAYPSSHNSKHNNRIFWEFF